jgi:hypothetical protein
MPGFFMDITPGRIMDQKDPGASTRPDYIPGRVIPRHKGWPC